VKKNRAAFEALAAQIETILDSQEKIVQIKGRWR
jgi:hypothetical protein